MDLQSKVMHGSSSAAGWPHSVYRQPRIEVSLVPAAAAKQRRRAPTPCRQWWPLPDEFLIRQATPADVEIIAHHRAAMFHDMGSAAPEVMEELAAATRLYLNDAIPRGVYIGWLAAPTAQPEFIVAGVGVQLRRVLPFPRQSRRRGEVAPGRQGIVVNVYTEKLFRRRGLARRLMLEVLSRAQALDSLVLHAAPEARLLYESLGFVATNEMRFVE
jgi:GNAT superfamily N-acetyltransferase